MKGRIIHDAGLTQEEEKAGLRVWTAFVRWEEKNPDTEEEIDVAANNISEARLLVRECLREDYNPGGEIDHWKYRGAGVMYL